MPVGLSDGGYHEDYSIMVADRASRMPLGSPTEPAGAFKSGGGSQTPEKSVETNSKGFFDRLSIVNAFRGMLGGSEEAVKNLPKNFMEGAEKILDTLKVPGQVAQGQIEPGSVQMVEKAADLAMLAIGAPAPVASKVADGTLGSFMGVKAKGFNKESLRLAQRLEQEGVHPDQIWKKTGTFRGADGRWRQEIADRQATLNEKAFDVTIEPGKPSTGSSWTNVGGTEDKILWSPKGKGYLMPPDTNDPFELLKYLGRMKAETPEYTPLDKVLNHSKLFEAYPELRGIKVGEYRKTGPGDTTQGMLRGDGTIELAPADPKFIRSVLLHEVQHAIQRIEGFARGGAPEEFMSESLRKSQKQFEKARNKTFEDITNEFPSLPNLEVHDIVASIKSSLEHPDDKGLKMMVSLYREAYPQFFDRLNTIAEAEHILATEADRQYTQYRRLMGEVESRNIQARRDFGMMERMIKTPRSTEDIPRFLQKQVEQTEKIQAK